MINAISDQILQMTQARDAKHVQETEDIVVRMRTSGSQGWEVQSCEKWIETQALNIGNQLRSYKLKSLRMLKIPFADVDCRLDTHMRGVGVGGGSRRLKVLAGSNGYQIKRTKFQLGPWESQRL